MVKRIVIAIALAAAGPALRAAENFADAGRAAHAFLTRLCDDHGGRLTGSPANRAAMQHLADELRALGLQPELQTFRMPGWERGRDRLEMIAPFARPLRAVTLAYCQPVAEFEAAVVDIGKGVPEDYPAGAAGCIGLLDSSSPLQVRVYLRTALEKGLRAVVQVNREGGGQLLARTGSFIGEANAIPIFSIAQEEGRSLQRLLARGVAVRLKAEVRSHCVEIETANLFVRIAGRSPGKVIVGAHFDSWDLGQGAMDNGIGVAQAYALARALRGRDLARTVELAWFNGEEQGICGSRHAAGRLGDEPIVAMVNLDMVGVPVAVNALGDLEMLAALERWHAARASKLPQGVQNINWFGSDHTPYLAAGVRAMTFNGPIPRESVRYYHDLADTIDKVSVDLITGSTEIIGEVVVALANDAALRPGRRSPAENEALFKTFGLEPRMRAIGWWPFP